MSLKSQYLRKVTKETPKITDELVYGEINSVKNTTINTVYG